MAKMHPEEFNFVQKTWILPSEYNAFQTHARDLKKKKKPKTFIAKPSNGAMGNGLVQSHVPSLPFHYMYYIIPCSISLLRNAEKIAQNENIIVQEYIDKPFLVEGFKCDMRIYVLVTSCDPLRVFLYNDGLLRMGTEKYVYPTDSNIVSAF
jgi:tubulin polyglutamylase TTLL7